MDLLTAMRIYRRVVELRAFSAAARDLSLSNASVSKHVSFLEDHLGARLLERTTRSLAVTPTGSAYYEKCARILDELEETEQGVRNATSAPRGLLRVNAPVAFAQTNLSPLITNFARRYPEIELDLTLSDRFVDLIEEGVDVAIRVSRELADSSSLVAQTLAKTRLVICGSPSYLRKHGTPRSPTDLSRFSCIEYSMVTRGHWPMPTEHGFVQVPVKSTFRVNNSSFARSAALAGLGLIYLPLFYVQPELEAGTLREILTSLPAAQVTLHAVYSRQRHLSARVRTFVDYMRKQLPSEPWAVR